MHNCRVPRGAKRTGCGWSVRSRPSAPLRGASRGAGEVQHEALDRQLRAGHAAQGVGQRRRQSAALSPRASQAAPPRDAQPRCQTRSPTLVLPLKSSAHMRRASPTAPASTAPPPQGPQASATKRPPAAPTQDERYPRGAQASRGSPRREGGAAGPPTRPQAAKGSERTPHGLQPLVSRKQRWRATTDAARWAKARAPGTHLRSPVGPVAVA